MRLLNLLVENKNVTINISTGTIIKVLGILLLLLFAYIIRDILVMIVISLIFASLIEPSVNFMEGKKIPRSLGVISIYVVLILFFGLTLKLLIPPIIDQIALLTLNFPTLWDRIVENLQSVQQFSEERGLVNSIQSSLETFQQGLTQAASGVYGFVIALFQNIVNFILVLVLTFFLVVEKNAVHKLFTAVAPAHYHDYLINLFHEIQRKIGDWARGQLILGLIISFLTFGALIFFLPKYALVLAIVAGVTELIPYIGPILGAIPAVFLGFTTPEFSVSRGVAVLIVFLVIQQLENNWLVPKVMQKTVGLNPIVVIIVMLVGARLAGIIGLVLAIPITTAVGVVIKDFMGNSGFPQLKQRLDHGQSTPTDEAR